MNKVYLVWGWDEHAGGAYNTDGEPVLLGVFRNREDAESWAGEDDVVEEAEIQ